jgi:membrane protein DedA with SNARE-associated domain
MHAAGMSAGALALGTLVSEDLACVAAGLLIARGELGAPAAVIACAAGILAGDVGLWAAGRLCGRAALQWRWVAGNGSGAAAGRMRALRAWIDRNAGAAIVGSRFLPGSRLPLYVLAGVLKMPAARFAWWATVATLLWTPAFVLLAAVLGQTVAVRLPLLFGATAAAVFAVRALTRATARRRIAAKLARWSRWEFWPMWLFYAPVAFHVARLAWRHGGIATVTAANPGIPDGGTVGESKAAILGALPPDTVIPFALIHPAPVSARADVLRATIAHRGWSYPLVLKPDVGERGTGVRLVKTADEAVQYLSRQSGPVIVQPYHPGPFEAGVFYYRLPGCARGRILSVTDKHFPAIVGDGTSTVEDLVWRHPRYRMQAHTFLERHRAVLSSVLSKGERLQLAIAGNHAQGTLFRDGRQLLTPALERRIDEIARACPGFFVGRFDIRYSDVDAFKAGADIWIVELNGATAESTSIYDPDTSLLDAYRQLFAQWSVVFEIGAANRAGGAPVSSRQRLFDLVRAHLAAPVVFALSD